MEMSPSSIRLGLCDIIEYRDICRARPILSNIAIFVVRNIFLNIDDRTVVMASCDFYFGGKIHAATSNKTVKSLKRF